MKAISVSDKKFLLIICSVVYPLSAAVFYNYPFMEYFTLTLRRISDVLSILFYCLVSYFPGLVALYFASRDLEGHKLLKQTVLFLGYLLVVVPMSLFLGFATACQINPNCVMP